MCRSIKTLFNFQPPVTEEEIRAASLQFVRKVSGFNKPSKANEAAFLAAVDEIAASAAKLLSALETNAPPKNRAEEAAKASRRFSEDSLIKRSPPNSGVLKSVINLIFVAEYKRGVDILPVAMRRIQGDPTYDVAVNGLGWIGADRHSHE